jgi:Domain of unknown function (DUF4430)
MRTPIAALLAVSLFTVLAAPLAQAAPAQVNVRIEGETETLFEGPILTDGHNVKAAESDPAAPQVGRVCDGTNNHVNPAPGPTPTAASVDAMGILGEDFDGRWYSGYDDFFVKRWGPDAQDVGQGEYWGLLVNDVFTNVGGCQYRLDGGDEVLWVYDAFRQRPSLALFAADAAYTAGARPLTATAHLGVPFPVEVVSYEDDEEALPPPAPGRAGSGPYEGAEVAPVRESEKGFEWVDTAAPETSVTGVDGRTSIAFSTAGWHRIKATRIGAGGSEEVVRSNRLDVCVLDPPALTDCGPPPADDLPRIPPALEIEEGDGGDGPGGEEPGVETPGSGGGPQSTAGPAADPGPVRLRLSPLDRSRLSRRLVRVSWRVLDPGPGIRRWTITSRALGRKRARLVTRAEGVTGTAASLRLPPGTYRLQLTVIDVLGGSATTPLGRVQVRG